MRKTILPIIVSGILISLSVLSYIENPTYITAREAYEIYIRDTSGNTPTILDIFGTSDEQNGISTTWIINTTQDQTGLVGNINYSHHSVDWLGSKRIYTGSGVNPIKVHPIEQWDIDSDELYHYYNSNQLLSNLYSGTEEVIYSSNTLSFINRKWASNDYAGWRIYLIVEDEPICKFSYDLKTKDTSVDVPSGPGFNN